MLLIPIEKQTIGAFCLRFAVFVFLALAVAGCGKAREKTRILERANRYYDAGEYDKAKIEYSALWRLDPSPNNAIALQQLGSIWMEEGAPLQAYPILLEARKLAPENLAVRTNLARVLVFLGETAAAREEAMAVLQKLPGEEDALLVLVDTVRNENDVAEVEIQLRKIPEGKDLAYHLAWAALAARKGDFAYARSELEEALKLSPNSARVHLSLANLYALQKDWKKAGEEYRVASDLSPTRSTARLKYAEFERESGHPEEAIRILREVTRKAPDYFPAWSLLAETALGQKKFDEALKLLLNILARDPTNREGLILQSRAWLGQGETKKAVEGLERLATTYPNAPLICYQLARAYLADNQPAQAVAVLDTAIAAQPDYADAVLLRGELDLGKDNARLVIPAMMKLLKAKPGLVPARFMLAEAYRAAGQLDDAVATIRALIQDFPQSADAWLRLGLVLRQQNKTEEARAAFERARELAPESLPPVEQLVDLDILQKNFQEALQLVEKQFANKPNMPGRYLVRGKIYAAQGDWAQAEADLRRTLKLDPNFSRAFDLLISTYVSAKKLSQARAGLQTFLSRRPDNAAALRSLARICTLMKDYPGARDAYEKLLSISPESTDAMNNLAYLYAEYLHQPEKACRLARQARTLRPTDPLIADTLGWALYQNGQYQEALSFLRESAGKLPENMEVQIHLGMASYMMADSGKAREALEKALTSGTDFPGETEARRRLAFLKEEAAPELSLDRLRALPRPAPDDVLAWMRFGSAYESHGAYEQAVAAYEEVTKINPKLLTPVLRLAQLCAGPLRKSERALEWAKRARELAPNDPQVAGVLGGIAYRLNNFQWAYSLLQESSRTLQRNPKILHDYAWTAYSLGKVSDARQAMQQVLTVHSEPEISADATSFLVLTALGEKLENLDASEAEIQKQLAVDPAYVPALLLRADLLAQRGDTKAAAVIYHDILRRYPEFKPAQNRLAVSPPGKPGPN